MSTPRLTNGFLGVAAWLALAVPALAAAGERTSSASIAWRSSEAEAFERARADGRPVVVDFWADWCGACAMLERSTFFDERVRSAMKRLVTVRMDGSENSDALTSGRYDAAAERWKVRVLPTLLFFDPGGKLLERIEGVVGPDELLRKLRAAETRCRETGACR